MGLSISQQIAKSMGGVITVAETSTGCQFDLILRLDRTKRQKKNEKIHTILDGRSTDLLNES